MASDRAKASNCVHRNISGTQGRSEHNTILCQYPVTSSRASSVDSPVNAVQGVMITRVLFPFDGENISGRELGTPSLVRSRFNNQRVF